MEKKKVMVAYFSATDGTRKIAEELRDVVNGDMFEIKPVKKYEEADLNLQDQDCRALQEQKDQAVRVEIEEYKDMSDYDVIFLGFPVWITQAPRIISTFVENTDLLGKTVVPFATSFASPMGTISKTLQSLCPDALFKEGKVFKCDASKEEIADWVASLEF